MKFSDLAGAIFDVDDTLLDNHPGGGPGLHERSRVAAAHEAGEKWGIAWLAGQTYEQAIQAFRTAPVHTLESCLWNTLKMAGVATDDEPDPNNELFRFLVRRKNELHEDILRQDWKEVQGAISFVALLARRGLRGKLAIASTAVRRDVSIFLELSGLRQYFPESHVITKELFTHAKPHPESFNLAFAALGLPESQRVNVVAFEDDPRGIMSAKAAGLYVAAITTRYSREELAALEVPPNIIQDSYADFERQLELAA